MSEVPVHDAEPVASGPPGDEVEAVDERAAELSQAERERRAEALALVRSFGDPVLRSRASEITEFGSHLQDEAARMVEIMHDAIGVGLAATQLGVMHRLLVFQAGLDATPTAVVNPLVEWVSPETEVGEEGCLSLPGIVVE